MLVTHIVGARPQFIKLSPVVASLQDGGIRCRIVHSGQHYDPAMARNFFDELGIPEPDINLDVGSGSHGEQTGAMMIGIEKDLTTVRPGAVVIYGDTNSTLAGGLAAAKLNIPIAHVEAGIRSHDFAMPEEINRVVADRVSTMLLAPSRIAVDNLLREGFAEASIRNVGDVMYDLALRLKGRAEERSSILERLDIAPRGYILATIHRAENTDQADRLGALVDGLILAARRLPVVVPLHPRTRGALERTGLLERARDGLTVIDPIGYMDMTKLEANAALVASDSGGVPKEAYFHQVKSVILREQPLWDELISLGWARLAPPLSAAGIAAAIEAMLAAPDGRMEFPYGRGDAAGRIREAVTALAEGSG